MRSSGRGCCGAWSRGAGGGWPGGDSVRSGTWSGWAGGSGGSRPRRALCAACGVSRVLLPDLMLRRRQYGVEVIWAALLAATRQQPWNQIAAGLGVPYTTVREWLRRFTRRADRVHAWLCGLLPRLVQHHLVWPPGTPVRGRLCAGGAGGRCISRCRAGGRLGGRVVAGAAGGPAVGVRAAGPVLAARGDKHQLAGDIAAGSRHLGVPGSFRSSPREVPRMSSAEHERLLRRARAQDAAFLFRYRLIGAWRWRRGPTTKQRGRVVRGIAGQVHAGPGGRGVQVSRKTLDRWDPGPGVRGGSRRCCPATASASRSPRRACWRWRRR